MNVRVNLLQEAELRHQGIVSYRFVFTLSASAAALAAVLLLGWGVLRYYSRGQDLKTAKKTWTETEPRYLKCLALQEAHDRQQALADELKGWQNSRLALSAVLAEIQRLVALRSIQFIRLSVSSQIEVIMPPPSPARKTEARPAGAKGDAEELAPAAAPAAAPVVPGTPARRYRIMIDGRASGEQAYQEVVDLGNDLRTAPALAALFESVRLQGLRQAMDVKDRPDERLFSIECVLFPRKIE